jgi:MFS superfamily sulfate permease-like transporter
MAFMPHNKMFGPNLKYDLPAGVVVFLIALPLCLGIALASGAPLVSGLIAGIVGGLVVGPLSGSMLSVSGPAAGLTVIVLGAIETLGGLEALFVAVVLAGVLQLIMGALRAGVIGYYFPASVIKGMLAGIGVILILKQIPHALGFDAAAMGVTAFEGNSQLNTFSELRLATQHFLPGALLIAVLTFGLLLVWQWGSRRNLAFFNFVPGPLAAVLVATLLNEALGLLHPTWQLKAAHLVQIPNLLQAETAYRLPQLNWSLLTSEAVWKIAFALAAVASIETLLSLEASDKLDPWKRTSPPNRELLAQGAGNVVSGLLGGLPVTSVIVRSSANITAGARTRLSTIFHGVCLLVLVLIIPNLLNRIPLSALAAILIFIGYKLSTVGLYRGMWKLGLPQFLPFMVTVVAILFTDLLQGIGVGMVVAIFFILRNNFKNAYQLEKDDQNGGVITMLLAQEVSYLNKGSIQQYLNRLPRGASIVIDGSQSTYIDQDVLEVIRDFRISAPSKHIEVKLIQVPEPALVIHH